MAAETGARALAADISDAERARSLVEEAGELDILVNNAGVTRDGLIARMSDDDWRTVLETNLGGTFYTCRAVARGMMRRRAGAIVNLTSIVGLHGNLGQTNYAASKAGIIGLTKSLARELGSRGVRANAIAPGYVDTRLTREIPEELRAVMLANTPLGRLGDPEDIAGAVRFLCSDEASFITGEILLDRRRTGDVMSESGMNGRRRVVITGLGCVTPLGSDLETTWSNLTAGESAAANITHFDHTEYPVHFACEASDFDPTRWIEKRTARRMDRFAQMIVAAARQAEADAEIRRLTRRRPGGRLHRDGHRRAAGLPGLLRRAARPRARSCQPVLDRRDHSEHGCRAGCPWSSARRSALLAVHGVRRLQHGDRRGGRCDQARPRGRDAVRRHRGPDHEHRNCRLRRHACSVPPE